MRKPKSRNSECPFYEHCLAKFAYVARDMGYFDCSGCVNEHRRRDPFTIQTHEIYGCVKLLHTVFSETGWSKYGERNKEEGA